MPSTNADLLAELTARVDSLVTDPVPLDEHHFAERAAAIDLLESDVLEGLGARSRALSREQMEAGGRGQAAAEADLLRATLLRAEEHRDRLERIDRSIFARLRAEIRQGLRGASLRAAIARYVRLPESSEARAGYDDLDDFLAGLLLPPPVPEAARPLEAGMVFYQPTPARAIMELIDRSRLARDEVLVDVGSGLGLVPMLVHLFTGARTVGIEVDPAYHRYAAGRAADLGIGHGAEFREADARESDFGVGDVIFLYTPFSGAMLDVVVRRLRDECSGRRVRLFSYGPCTATIARQAWLEPVGPVDSAERLAMFIAS